MNNREQWDQKYTNDQVYDLVQLVKFLQDQVAELYVKVAELEQGKADRRGRKPKGSTGGVHQVKSVENP